MRYSKGLAFAILLAVLTSIPISAPAQVSINIGPEPACPYGYYDDWKLNLEPAHLGDLNLNTFQDEWLKSGRANR